MDLDELERRGDIKRLPRDMKKIEDSLNLAKRDVNVARSVLNENCDWAFSIAYNAMLQAVRALMFSKGYLEGLNTSLTLSQVLGRLNTSFTIVVIQRRKSIVHLMMRYGKTK